MYNNGWEHYSIKMKFDKIICLEQTIPKITKKYVAVALDALSTQYKLPAATNNGTLQRT